MPGPEIITEEMAPRTGEELAQIARDFGPAIKRFKRKYEVAEAVRTRRLFVVCGPSFVGKDRGLGKYEERAAREGVDTGRGRPSTSRRRRRVEVTNSPYAYHLDLVGDEDHRSWMMAKLTADRSAPAESDDLVQIIHPGEVYWSTLDQYTKHEVTTLELRYEEARDKINDGTLPSAKTVYIIPAVPGDEWVEWGRNRSSTGELPSDFLSLRVPEAIGGCILARETATWTDPDGQPTHYVVANNYQDTLGDLLFDIVEGEYTQEQHEDARTYIDPFVEYCEGLLSGDRPFDPGRLAVRGALADGGDIPLLGQRPGPS